MSLIINCGFQPVNINIFRKKSISKGRNLVMSKHVGDVKEVIGNGQNFIVGTVLRETPGAASTKNKQNYYNPSVELDPSRNILSTFCNCKAGRGMCKHAAAICIFVNNENTMSKTDMPMLWNRPPENQLKKYCTKGCTIDSLFPSTKGNISKEVFRFEEIKNIFENKSHLKEKSDLINFVKEAKKLENEQEERFLLNEETKRKNRQLIDLLFELQLRDCKLYHSFTCYSVEKFKFKFCKTKCPESCEKYFAEKVLVTESDWKEICLQSIDQSNTIAWFDQRRFRITASSKAHRIRTRQNIEDFPFLANKLAQETYQGRLTPAMEYGISMEPVARQFFEEQTSLHVYPVGLVVCFKQPYLGCSPDGIVLNENVWELVEFKCPFTCKDLKITNSDDSSCNVPYLKFNSEGQVELKQTDKYYTQIQLSLYVTGMKMCHFVVYSSLEMMHLKIERNEEFLSQLVPKLDYFYYNHLIHVFATE